MELLLTLSQNEVKNLGEITTRGYKYKGDPMKRPFPLYTGWVSGKNPNAVFEEPFAEPNTIGITFEEKFAYSDKEHGYGLISIYDYRNPRELRRIMQLECRVQKGKRPTNESPEIVLETNLTNKGGMNQELFKQVFKHDWITLVLCLQKAEQYLVAFYATRKNAPSKYRSIFGISTRSELIHPLHTTQADILLQSTRLLQTAA